MDADREVMNTYGPDWKAIFVGDATMSPFEITEIVAHRTLE